MAADVPVERLQRVLVELESRDYDKPHAVVDERCPYAAHLVQRVEDCLLFELRPTAHWWPWVVDVLADLAARVDDNPHFRIALAARDAVTHSLRAHADSDRGRVWLVKMFSAARALYSVFAAAYDMPTVAAQYYTTAAIVHSSVRDMFLALMRRATHSFHVHLDSQHAAVGALFADVGVPLVASDSPMKLGVQKQKPPRSRVIVKRVPRKSKGRSPHEGDDTGAQRAGSVDDGPNEGSPASPLVVVETQSRGVQAVEIGRELGLLVVDASSEEVQQLHERQARYDEELARHEAREADIARREAEVEGKDELLEWALKVQRPQAIELLTQLAALHQRVVEAEARAADAAAGYSTLSLNSSVAQGLPKLLHNRVVHVLDLASNNAASERLGCTRAGSTDAPRVSTAAPGGAAVAASLRTDDVPVVVRESQLTIQGYRCAECGEQLQNTQLIKKPRRCFYTGQLYCMACHHNRTAPLPAQIVHHFDFAPRKVCDSAHSFLTSIEAVPVLNIAQLNPGLFNEVPRLQASVEMRRRLSRCLQLVRRHVPDALAHDSHEYLMAHPECYAVADLALIHGREHATHTSLLKSLQARLLGLARKEQVETDARAILGI